MNIVFILAISIQGVSKVLGQTAGVSNPNQKRTAFCQCMSADSFLGTVQWRVDFSPLDFYLWGNFKHPIVFTSNRKRRNTPPTHFLCLVYHAQLRRPFWKECDSPWSDVTTRALYRWRIFWAFVVNCVFISSKNWAVIRLGTCLASVLFKNKMLHSSGIYCWMQSFS